MAAATVTYFKYFDSIDGHGKASLAGYGLVLEVDLC